MPILMPTPDELQRIPGHKRERIQRAIANILTGIDDVAHQETQRVNDRRKFGDLVLRDARILEQTEPRDSPTTITQRRIALLQAISPNTPRQRLIREANATPSQRPAQPTTQEQP